MVLCVYRATHHIPDLQGGWTVFALAMLTTLGFQILSNFANDYGDGIKGTDNEDRIGPKRAIQSGVITPQAMKKAMTITTVLTLISAIALIYFACCQCRAPAPARSKLYRFRHSALTPPKLFANFLARQALRPIRSTCPH